MRVTPSGIDSRPLHHDVLRQYQARREELKYGLKANPPSQIASIVEPSIKQEDQIQISEAALKKAASLSVPPLAAMVEMAETMNPEQPQGRMRSQILNYLLSQGVPRERVYAQLENIMLRLGYVD